MCERDRASTRKGLPKPRPGKLLRVFRRVDHRGHPEEFVGRARVHFPLNRDAGRVKRLGKHLTVIAQRIDRRVDDGHLQETAADDASADAGALFRG